MFCENGSDRVHHETAAATKMMVAHNNEGSTLLIPVCDKCARAAAKDARDNDEPLTIRPLRPGDRQNEHMFVGADQVKIGDSVAGDGTDRRRHTVAKVVEGEPSPALGRALRLVFADGGSRLLYPDRTGYLDTCLVYRPR